MNADAIYQVTQALRIRLEKAIEPPDPTEPPGTVFVGPLDAPEAEGASLILFLYRVTPNASLRNREHVVPSSAPPPTVFNNSLPLDLYYLLTIGTRHGLDNDPLLRLLGLAMQALQFDPELTGPDVRYESVHVSLEPLTMEETNHIWALFPTENYRTTVAYVATPVWIDPPQLTPAAAAVVEDTLDAGLKAPASME